MRPMGAVSPLKGNNTKRRMFKLPDCAWEIEDGDSAAREEARRQNKRTPHKNPGVDREYRMENGTLSYLVDTVFQSAKCNVVLTEPSIGELRLPALSVN